MRLVMGGDGIMRAFGDAQYEEVTTAGVSVFLRELDRAGLTPRNVNKHRQVLAAILKYVCRADTYALAVNPVTGTDERREDPQPRWTTTKCTRSKLSLARAREVSSASVGRSSTPTRSSSEPAKTGRTRRRFGCSSTPACAWAKC
jgi:hypothetical protein